MERAQRRHQTQVAITRQAKIAVAHLMDASQRGRFRKQRAMDCGNPGCACGNQRHLGGQHGRTLQELRSDAQLRADQRALAREPVALAA
jgi:hypothetical protein